jgi:hypothetical protein
MLNRNNTIELGETLKDFFITLSSLHCIKHFLSFEAELKKYIFRAFVLFVLYSHVKIRYCRFEKMSQQLVNVKYKDRQWQICTLKHANHIEN